MVHFIKTLARFLAAIISVVITCSNVPALAQYYPSMPPGMSTTVLNFNGAPVTCMSQGLSTVFYFNYQLGDTATTNYFVTPTVIQINPVGIMAFYNIDPRTALFVIGHECGHAYLLTADENVADCFSATLGAEQGWFGPADMPAMTVEWQNNPGNWSHPPGAVRLRHIQKCMTDALNGAPDINIP
jgi:hypothetical protein